MLIVGSCLSNVPSSRMTKFGFDTRFSSKSLYSIAISSIEPEKDFQAKIENLQNQVNSLHQKLIELEENQTLNLKHALSELYKRSQATKIEQQGDSRLNPQSANYLPNDSEVRNPTYEVSAQRTEAFSDCETKLTGMESKSVSDASKIDSKSLSNTQRYNLSSNQEKGLNEPNFITLGKISEEEKIEIIKLGFQLNQEGKISLKKYYEGTGESSLFQLKGYSIRYEAIRKNHLYKQLKNK